MSDITENKQVNTSTNTEICSDDEIDTQSVEVHPYDDVNFFKYRVRTCNQIGELSKEWDLTFRQVLNITPIYDLLCLEDVNISSIDEVKEFINELEIEEDDALSLSCFNDDAMPIFQKFITEVGTLKYKKKLTLIKKNDGNSDDDSNSSDSENNNTIKTNIDDDKLRREVLEEISDSMFSSISDDLLNKLTQTAEYICCNDLIDCIVFRISNIVNERTVEECREFFGTENEFTADQEAEIRERFRYAFEDEENSTETTPSEQTNTELE